MDDKKFLAETVLKELNGGPLTFGQALKAWRQSEEWSQEDLAKKIAVTKMTISKFETGKMLPASDTLERISKAFKVDILTFLPYVLQDYAALHGKFKVEVKAG